jgi:hypothetical protein
LNGFLNATSSTAPDFKNIAYHYLSSKFGISGIVVFCIAIICLLSLWYWDKIKTLPLIRNILALLSRKSLPKADPNFFTVIIADLVNDSPDRQNKTLIIEDLKEIKGISVKSIDRMILIEGSDTEKMEKTGHDKARKYLHETWAQVIIWGTVLAHEGKTIPKLYWTVAEDIIQEKRYDRYQISEFRLPELFWNDLGNILCLLAVNYASQFYAKSGHYISDQIAPFIEKVRSVLDGGVRGDLIKENRSQIQSILASALLTLGEQTGQRQPLIEAISFYEEALKERTRERVPLDWAATQNDLGNVLWRLGERESGAERLEEAVAAYREA